MAVRRTQPQRARTLIGAWCFADHYGPDDVSLTDGMDVAPHPHAGLQTVSRLFSGEREEHSPGTDHRRAAPPEPAAGFEVRFAQARSTPPRMPGPAATRYARLPGT